MRIHTKNMKLDEEVNLEVGAFSHTHTRTMAKSAFISLIYILPIV